MPPAPHEATLRAAIVIVTLMLVALFLASAVSALLAGGLLRRTAAPSRPYADEPFGSAVEVVDPRDVLARNVFDPSTGPLWPPRPTGSPPETACPGSVAPACDGLRLVATLQVESRREDSLASLASGTGAADLFREGSAFGRGALVSIAVDSITLRQTDGCLCSLALFDSTPVQEPERLPTGNPADAGVRALGENEYAIARPFVEQTLARPEAVLGMVRTAPHVQAGKVVGFKLYGVRRDGLLYRLGLQNGDILRSVGGFELTSPEQALDAYASLREAQELSLAITRRGRPLLLRYLVR